MPLPNTSTDDQGRVNPSIRTNLQQQNARITAQQQKIAEILAMVQDRLTNITSVKQTVQQGAFNAFGNNFITRGAFQIGDMLSDAFDTLIDNRTDEEKQQKDPQATQNKILAGLLQNSTVTNHLLQELLEKEVSSRESDKNKNAPRDSVKTSSDTGGKYEFTADQTKRLETDFKPRSTDEAIEEPKTYRANVDEIIDPEQKPKSLVKRELIENQSFIDVDAREIRENEVRTPSDSPRYEFTPDKTTRIGNEGKTYRANVDEIIDPEQKPKSLVKRELNENQSFIDVETKEKSSASNDVVNTVNEKKLVQLENNTVNKSLDSNTVNEKKLVQLENNTVNKSLDSNDVVNKSLDSNDVVNTVNEKKLVQLENNTVNKSLDSNDVVNTVNEKKLVQLENNTVNKSLDEKAQAVSRTVDDSRFDNQVGDELDDSKNNNKTKFFKDAIRLLTKISTGVEKLNTAPISTQESDLEKLTKPFSLSKLDKPQAISSDITSKQAEPSSQNDIFSKIFDLASLKKIVPLFVSSIAGITSVAKKFGSILSDAAASIVSKISPFVSSVATKGAEFVKAGVDKAKDLATKGVELVKTGASKVSDLTKAGVDKAKDLATKGVTSTTNLAKSVTASAVDLADAGVKKVSPIVNTTVDKAASIGTKGTLTASADKLADVGASTLTKGAEITKTVGTPAATSLSKGAGTIAKFGMKALKAVPLIGTAVAAADAAYSGFNGWNDAKDTLGIDGREATTGEKLASASGGVIESLSFGLIDKQKAAKWLAPEKKMDMASSERASLDSSKIKTIREETTAVPRQDVLETASKELSKMEKMRDTQVASSTGSTNVINNTSVNNQTIMPTRHNPRNDEFSFNRYLTKTFA
jgi:hypothetical protein